MKKIVVDTSIIIDFLRSNNKQNSLLYKLAEEDLYISIVTHTELYAGKSIWVDNEAKESLEKVDFLKRINLFKQQINQVSQNI